MTTHPPLIELEAVDAARNIQRRYAIEWGRDLLGDWVVETRWGRIGQRERRRIEVFDQEAKASAAVTRHLRRRQSAERRIGVGYAPRALRPPRTPPPVYSTRLRHYLWIDGFDGWVEDEPDAILAAHPARDALSPGRIVAQARLRPTTYAWGLYADGRHIAGKTLFISEHWAEQEIARLLSAAR